MSDQSTPSPPATASQLGRPSPRRQLAQARALNLVFGIALVAVSAFVLLARSEDARSVEIVAISVVFAILTIALRAATIGGAASGALICLSLVGWTAGSDAPLLHSALPPLFTLFVLTFLATRSGRSRKERQGLAERRSGRRASQVFANLGTAALIVSPLGAYLARALGIDFPIPARVLCTAALAALAEATADTVSSEIGQAFGAKTLMITTLRQVPRGTDGGISLLGTSAGILASAAVVVVGVVSFEQDRITALTAIVASTLGLFADSLVGATLERRGWIGNDLVNLAGTAVAAAVSLLLSRFW